MALSGYGVYAEVTFAASAVDEAIPFCTVYLSDLPTAWHDAMANAGDTDGRTIRVTKSDGTTECAVYVPPGSVNTSTDTGALFFRATDLSAVLDTTYMIWVGNAASTMYLSADTYGRNAVFTGYAGAYIPGMLLDDLTGAGRNLIAVNTPGTAASGYEGITAATYNGTDQYHHYTNASQAVEGYPFTLGGIAEFSSHSADMHAWAYGNTVSFNDFAYVYASTHPSYVIRIKGSSGSSSIVGSFTSLSDNTSYYTLSSRDANSGTTTVRTVGVSIETETTTVTDPDFDNITIGASKTPFIGNYFNGKITFVESSTSVRSADYASTMLRNWAGTLYTAGSVQYVAGTTGKLKLQSAATTSASGSLPNWADAANALTRATDFATVSVDWDIYQDSEFLNLTNIAYNFAVPSGKSNYSAKFYVTRRHVSPSNRISDLSVRFIDETGAYAGADMAVYGAWSVPASTAEYTVSGTVLGDTSFDASTGLAFQVTQFNVADTGEARVEFVCVEITWDDAPPATTSGNFFLAFL